MELNEIWCDIFMIGVVDARSVIFEMGSFIVSWAKVIGQISMFSSVSP